LNSEKSRPDGHSQARQERKKKTASEVAQSIKGKDKKRNPWGVKRIFALGLRSKVGVNGYVRPHVKTIIMLVIVVFQVEVSVKEKAMAHEEIMRLVPRKD